MNIDNIINDYLTNNRLDKGVSLTSGFLSDIKEYQKSLPSYVQQTYKQKRTGEEFKDSYVTPMNNLNFINGLSLGLNPGSGEQFTEAAFIALSSLTNENNKFFIDIDGLTRLFKSGTNVVELPYALVLYLGGLYHFRNGNITNRLSGGVNVINDIYYKLDGHKIAKNREKLDLKLNGSLSPFYGGTHFEDSFKAYAAAIPIVTDVLYDANNYKINMPNFGYGTLSSFMNDYHYFFTGKYIDPAQTVGTPNIDNMSYHAVGGRNGSVKSFKAYQHDAVNFMGHYGVLFNNMNVNYNDAAIRKEYNDFIKNIVNIDDYKAKVIDLFLIYGKIKIAYLTNVLTKETLTKLITDLSTPLDKINPIYYTNTGSLNVPCTSFAYFIYNFLYSDITEPDNRVNISPFVNNPLGLTAKTEATYLLNFLLGSWDAEKTYNAGNNFPGIDDNLLLMLYPSAGGVYYPNNVMPKDVVLAADNLIDFKTVGFSNSRQRNKHVNESRPDKKFEDRHYAYLPGKPTNPNPYKAPTRGGKAYFAYNFNSSVDTQDRVLNMVNTLFDNRSLVENSTRVLWFDTANGGTQLGSSDNLVADLSTDKIETDNDSLLTRKIGTDYLTAIYKNTEGTQDLTTTAKYKIKDLYDSIDIEKLEYFERAFIEFASTGNVAFGNNNNNYSFETLLKAMTTVGYADLSKLTYKGRIYSQDELAIIVAAYSSFYYYFGDTYGVAALINATLTQAQYNKVVDKTKTGVLNEFLCQRLPINNYSAIGATILPNRLTNFGVDYHGFIFRPDVIFPSDTLTVNEANCVYYFRKLVFGDQILPSYNTPKSMLRIPIDLVETYVNYPSNGLDNMKKVVIDPVVDLFFKKINISYEEDYVKILLPLLNNFISKIVVDTNIVKTNPFTKISSLDKDAVLKRLEEYLIAFINDFFKQNTEALKFYFDAVSSNITDLINPGSANSIFRSQAKIDTINELKNSTYYNVKGIYDRYGSYKPDDFNYIKEDFANLNVSELLNNPLFYNYNFLSNDGNPKPVFDKSNYDGKKPKFMYEYVKVLDRANNDIGNKILVDLAHLQDQITMSFNKTDLNEKINGRSVFTLFSELASHNGFLLHPISSYANLTGVVNEDTSTHADKLFGVHTDLDTVGSNPAFILQFSSLTSSIDNNKKNDRNRVTPTNSFVLDIDINQGKRFVNTDTAPADILESGNVSAFVVDFANKNQNMFSNVQLSTDEFANTEESISAYVNLVSDDEKNGSKLSSGNLFKAMETRSYTCQVDSLGNALIQPLSYFYLKHVPLFGGSYWITNVTHKITPNNMITTFKGVRQPIAQKTTNQTDIIRILDTNNIAMKNSEIQVGKALVTKSNSKGRLNQILEGIGVIDQQNDLSQQSHGTLRSLVAAILVKEGTYLEKYDRNNPGNLVYQSSFSNGKYGDVVPGGGDHNFAKFKNAKAVILPDGSSIDDGILNGVSALINLKIRKWAKEGVPTKNKTFDSNPTNPFDKSKRVFDDYIIGSTKPNVLQFFTIYAPPSENDTQQYVMDVLKTVNEANNTDFKWDTSVYQIITYNK